jgi:putative endonuclease
MDTSTGTTSPEKSVSVSRQLELGRRGEQLAAAYLQQEGYRIVAANFVVPVGRNRVGAVINVEIDLVAYDGATLCFIEAKARESDWFAPPQVNVDRRKQRQIARAARAYRRMFGLAGASYRYDVITIVLPAEEESNAGPEIQLLRNYWTEDQLRKRMWSERYYE